jgi:hypothetical protein
MIDKIAFSVSDTHFLICPSFVKRGKGRFYGYFSSDKIPLRPPFSKGE